MTALEYFQILWEKGYDYNYCIKEAKELFEQQIKDAYNQGYREGLDDCGNVWMTDKDVEDCSNAEDYYNETYKGTKL